MRTWLAVGLEDRENADCVWTVEAEFFPRFPEGKNVALLGCWV